MSPKLRICFLAPASNVHTVRWVSAIAERGHDVLLISDEPSRGLPVRTFNPYDDMGLLALVPKVRAYAAQRSILRRIRQFAPDVVHLHWLHATLGTVHITRRLENLIVSVWGKDLIWDGDTTEPWMRVHYRKLILARALQVTATSRFLADRTRPFLAPGVALSIVPFGVDCDKFRPVPPGSPRSVPVIGYLKHYSPKYGPDVLLRAAALLAAQSIAFRVEMYGTKDPEPYRAMARELGIQERVSVSGAVEHGRVAEVLNRFDVYAMPSIYDSETFGVAALEASACGVPVVATQVGGVPEVITDGVTGVLVRPNDAEQLAEALARLLGDASLRATMGAEGRALVLRSYRWDRCVDQMEDLYLRTQAGERGGV